MILTLRKGGLVTVHQRFVSAASTAAAAASAHQHPAPQRKRHSVEIVPPPAAPSSVTTLAVAVRDAAFLRALRAGAGSARRSAHAHARAPAPAPAKGRKHVCPDCHKTFIWSTHLKRHMTAHRRKGSPRVIADEGLLQKMQSVLRSMQDKDRVSPPQPPAKALRSLVTTVSSPASSSEMKKKRSLRSVEGEIKEGRRPSAQRQGYICPVCHKVFPWLCVLKSHIQSHTDVQVYRCSKCDFMTTIPQALTEHLFTHIEQEPVKCQECDAEFSSTRFLIRHINSVHGYPSAAPRAPQGRSKAL